ncbi:5-formyltetrahydrofolate cyclo-ligase [Actinoplanes sp. TBRC 11911]|uniref:5-formyltetrahydrofolate cyclo-ligase n=1 Tax=Actinoplanes sp. TBRC 11911 TaxID=2729386 RepID=UPI00145ECB94|nr:5-formyltetrahydrofolate cyclo-ligase [Actinoplanes sp. TBRC 11911]NMO50288.1 5-formyltetrahydrofolate cyclo-ligase [Actinoplanes sp. TBRC 11911]
MSDLTGDAEKSRAAKIALRGRLLTQRRSLSPSARASFAAALQDQILALVRRERPSTIAAYVPVGAEPGGPALPSVLSGVVSRVLLPVLLPSGDLDWAAYAGALVAGPRGLLEPPGPRLGVSAVRSAEVILVPALAVDRQGMRMGRGGGSYDRALARVGAGSLIVALLHDGELVPSVPAEGHDRPVHGVVTPGGFVSLAVSSRPVVANRPVVSTRPQLDG